MRTLIFFSSRDGQMREIAEYLASELKELGIWADAANLHRTTKPDWQDYSSVMINASIHYGHHHTAFREFVKRYVTRLNLMLGMFYSVNLVAHKLEKRTPQTNSYARKPLMSSPWRPNHSAVIAGALLYPHYRQYDRVMIQLITKMSGGETDASKEVMYTDWEQVTRFVQEIVQSISKASLK